MADRSEFLRAYGNRSAEDVAGRWQALDEAVWLRQIDPEGIPASARVSFGVWIGEDGEDAAVAAGFRDESEQMRSELVQVGSDPALFAGIRWVKAYVLDRVAKAPDSFVTMANVGASRDVADELAAAGVPVVLVSQADLTAACGRHRSELAAGTWWHRASDVATKAAGAAGWVKAGGGHRWEQPGDSISALGAQTLAGWGSDHAPAPAPKLGRFRIR